MPETWKELGDARYKGLIAMPNPNTSGTGYVMMTTIVQIYGDEPGFELLKAISDNPKTQLIGLAWMDSGARNFYNKVRDIKSVEDLKGLKVRMMGNPIFVDTMNALGGNGVAMGMDQVMNALQTGVVDGAENNPPSYDSFGHVPVAKHYTLTEHLIIPELLVFSRRSFDAMSKEDQALILKFGSQPTPPPRSRPARSMQQSPPFPLITATCSSPSTSSASRTRRQLGPCGSPRGLS